MIKFRSVFWVVLIFSNHMVSIAQEAPKVEKRRLLDGRIELLMPVGFTEMTPESLKSKYPSSKPPQLVITDERGATNVALTWSQSSASQAELSSYKVYLQAALEKAQPKAKWYNQGIQDIDGRQVGYLELLTPVPDGVIYNLIFFTDMEERLLMVSFNCLEEEIAIWKPTAQQIMKSLRVVKP